MRIQREALLYVAVASVSWANIIDAFAPSQIIRPRTPFVTQGSDLVARTVFSKRSLACLWSKEEDDEDADEDDDDDDAAAFEEPLSKGIDSVQWLPSVENSERGNDDSNTALVRKDSEIMPLFPLGGIVYTPNSEHVLNIFEPRYRQMYTDILMNGSKRFVVAMSHPTEKGRFAEMGVLFELEDLKEVSEQTQDQVKYVCNHKVTGRVKMHRIINPEAWESRDTYLRVEGSITDDSGKQDSNDDDDEEEEEEEEEKKEPSNDVYGVLSQSVQPVQGNPKEERALRTAFGDLIDIQHDLEEDVRFTKASVISLALKSGSGSDGLWQTIRLWQSFAEQRYDLKPGAFTRSFLYSSHTVMFSLD
jgi:Lon protease-like protein